MPQTIRLKRSSVPGKVPTVSDLDLGEIGINTFDGAIFIKKNNNQEQIVKVGEEVVQTRYEHGLITTNSFVCTTSSPDQIIDTFDKDQYNAAKYLIKARSGNEVHCSEILLIHNGDEAFLTEYAKVISFSPLGFYDAFITQNSVQLLFSPVDTQTTVKLFRQLIES